MEEILGLPTQKKPEIHTFKVLRVTCCSVSVCVCVHAVQSNYEAGMQPPLHRN
jgi:hypothetical protein